MIKVSAERSAVRRMALTKLAALATQPTSPAPQTASDRAYEAGYRTFRPAVQKIRGAYNTARRNIQRGAQAVRGAYGAMGRGAYGAMGRAAWEAGQNMAQGGRSIENIFQEARLNGGFVPYLQRGGARRIGATLARPFTAPMRNVGSFFRGAASAMQ